MQLVSQRRSTAQRVRRGKRHLVSDCRWTREPEILFGQYMVPLHWRLTDDTAASPYKASSFNSSAIASLSPTSRHSPQASVTSSDAQTAAHLSNKSPSLLAGARLPVGAQTLTDRFTVEGVSYSQMKRSLSVGAPRAEQPAYEKESLLVFFRFFGFVLLIHGLATIRVRRKRD